MQRGGKWSFMGGGCHPEGVLNAIRVSEAPAEPEFVHEQAETQQQRGRPVPSGSPFALFGPSTVVEPVLNRAYAHHKLQFNKSRRWAESHAKQMAPPPLNRKVASLVEEWFTLVDRDESRTLDAAELEAALRSADIPCKPGSLEELIRVMDINKDGLIDWQEFHAFISCEVHAGQDLLSGHLQLPSGLSLPLGPMVNKIRRNLILNKVIEGGKHRRHGLGMVQSYLKVIRSVNADDVTPAAQYAFLSSKKHEHGGKPGSRGAPRRVQSEAVMMETSTVAPLISVRECGLDDSSEDGEGDMRTNSGSACLPVLAQEGVTNSMGNARSAGSDAQAPSWSTGSSVVGTLSGTALLDQPTPRDSSAATGQDQPSYTTLTFSVSTPPTPAAGLRGLVDSLSLPSLTEAGWTTGVASPEDRAEEKPSTAPGPLPSPSSPMVRARQSSLPPSLAVLTKATQAGRASTPVGSPHRQHRLVGARRPGPWSDQMQPMPPLASPAQQQQWGSDERMHMHTSDSPAYALNPAQSQWYEQQHHHQQQQHQPWAQGPRGQPEQEWAQVLPESWEQQVWHAEGQVQHHAQLSQQQAAYKQQQWQQQQQQWQQQQQQAPFCPQQAWASPKTPPHQHQGSPGTFNSSPRKSGLAQPTSEWEGTSGSPQLGRMGPGRSPVSNAFYVRERATSPVSQSWTQGAGSRQHTPNPSPSRAVSTPRLHGHPRPPGSPPGTGSSQRCAASSSTRFLRASLQRQCSTSRSQEVIMNLPKQSGVAIAHTLRMPSHSVALAPSAGVSAARSGTSFVLAHDA